MRNLPLDGHIIIVIDAINVSVKKKCIYGEFLM